jgi:hypothetical protein
MTEQMTDKEWADYFAEVLKRLDMLAEQPPKEDAPRLQKLVEAACDPLAVLVGYLSGI